MSSFLMYRICSVGGSSGSLSRLRPHMNQRSTPPAIVRENQTQADEKQQQIFEEPLVIFQNWLIAAQREAPQVRPRLACMATVDKAGEPVTRLTCIEDVTPDGITFFTTLGSRQAGEISANPHVSLQFNWAPLMRTVRISGTAHQMSNAQAMDQFRQYPRHVQMSITHGPRYAAADWHSRNGFFQRITQRLRNLMGKEEAEIPMPANWGGYLLTPSLFEFGMLSGPKAARTRVRFRRCLEVPRGTRMGTVQAERTDWVYDSMEECD
ncbi:hypothetical protein KR054_006741 [Drosophila jambulina]|nr:hypothetical protein KR054_006741 [Drosophila jambulina]